MKRFFLFHRKSPYSVSRNFVPGVLETPRLADPPSPARSARLIQFCTGQDFAMGRKFPRSHSRAPARPRPLKADWLPISKGSARHLGDQPRRRFAGFERARTLSPVEDARSHVGLPASSKRPVPPTRRCSCLRHEMADSLIDQGAGGDRPPGIAPVPTEKTQVANAAQRTGQGRRVRLAHFPAYCRASSRAGPSRSNECGVPRGPIGAKIAASHCSPRACRPT